jgi:tRNA(fMet)-specific endonuclease VapC
MIYLLDTDILIHLIRGLKAPARAAARRNQANKLVTRCQKAQASGDQVGVSAITVSELEFGAQNSGQYAAEIAAVRKILAPFDVFDFDGADCPLHYGRIRHELESAGQVIGSMDLLIAAQALALDATLVTRNQTHFSRVKRLKIVDWP